MRKINGEFLDDEQFKNAVVKDEFISKLKPQIGSINVKNILAMNSIKAISHNFDIEKDQVIEEDQEIEEDQVIEDLELNKVNDKLNLNNQNANYEHDNNLSYIREVNNSNYDLD